MLPQGWDRRTTVLLTFALLFVISSKPAPAQTFDLDKGREPVASLDDLWRFHPGDDPDGKLGWANPGFDDSAWQSAPFPQAATQSQPAGDSVFAWYRVRIPVLDPAQEHAILLPAVNTSYQVFADGRLIAGYGALPPHPKLLVSQPQVILLPGSGAASITLAVRLWTFRGVNGYDSFPARVNLQFGAPVFVRQKLEMVLLKSRLTLTITYFFAIFYLLGALATLAVYLFRRGEKEYLWFALYLFAFGALHIVWAIRANSAISYLACGVVQYSLFAGTGLATLLLYRRLLKGRRSWFFWCAFAAVVVVCALSLADLAGFLGRWTIPYFLWTISDSYILILTIQRARKGMPDARMILIPVCITCPMWFIQDSLSLWGFLGLNTPFAGNFLFETFQSPFPFSLADIFNLLFVVGMMAIMIHRFARVSRQEEEHASELEAARTVQQVLIPEEIPSIPGLTLECVYKPAGQVGGDFFQILPTTNNGALIVIGDVSGKGMPAAMAVSLLVGTVRTLAHYTHSPAEILNAMNLRMLGRSKDGFTTCLVLRLDPDGTATIANAGHLAPYLGCNEFPVDPGLPLGLAAEAEYPESTFHLDTGEQLTLVTDGIAEARAKTGELFGFERTASIAILSALQIAATAQAFGQQDDITVLKIRRQPVMVGAHE